MTVTAADLGVYLGITLSEDQTARATMLITDVTAQALAVITPLPDGSDGVIRGAVARIFLNPAGVTSETVGPFGATRPAGTGAMLSKNECVALRRLAGSGGAFEIDLLPDTYCPDVGPWDIGGPVRPVVTP